MYHRIEGSFKSFSDGSERIGVDDVTGPHWLTIGEACRVLGISRTTLLAAEDAALIAPARTPGGHRRYTPAELQRYLSVAGAVPHPSPLATPTGPPPADVTSADLAATVRAAARPLVRALDGESAGLYLVGDSGLRFAGAFGVPRWLAGRLAGRPPPAQVAAALPATRARLFDPAATGFPDPRSSGHGAAVGLHVDGRPAGVLFLVTRAEHGLLPAEIRVAEALAEVVALLVGQHLRALALQDRLDRVAAACAG